MADQSAYHWWNKHVNSHTLLLFARYLQMTIITSLVQTFVYHDIFRKQRYFRFLNGTYLILFGTQMLITHDTIHMILYTRYHTNKLTHEKQRPRFLRNTYCPGNKLGLSCDTISSRRLTRVVCMPTLYDITSNQ